MIVSSILGEVVGAWSVVSVVFSVVTLCMGYGGLSGIGYLWRSRSNKYLGAVFVVTLRDSRRETQWHVL
ncbi:MAG: hypothetical protein KBF19_01500 [Negativicutes bacterium]|nr:hypothetical protein [Negativicutes bacterium]